MRNQILSPDNNKDAIGDKLYNTRVTNRKIELFYNLPVPIRLRFLAEGPAWLVDKERFDMVYVVK